MKAYVILAVVAFSPIVFSLQEGSGPTGSTLHDHVEVREESHEIHSDGDGEEDHKDHEVHSAHSEDKTPHENHDDHEEDEPEHEDHEENKSIGKGKAIEAVDEVEGFKLSTEAITTLNLSFKSVSGTSLTVSKSTLVTSKDRKGVYRYRDGFFKLLDADITKEMPTAYQLTVPGLRAGDRIVIGGIGLLRTTEVFSTDSSEYGHSH